MPLERTQGARAIGSPLGVVIAGNETPEKWLSRVQISVTEAHPDAVFAVGLNAAHQAGWADNLPVRLLRSAPPSRAGMEGLNTEEKTGDNAVTLIELFLLAECVEIIGTESSSELQGARGLAEIL